MKKLLQKYRDNRAEADRVVRFAVTGVWNTLFGILAYAALYEWLKDSVNYLVLLVPGNILAITNAFICHKLFVFRTCGGTALLGFALMFVLVDGFGFNPVAAQVLCVPIAVSLSYISHRNYSFRAPKNKAGV